jgi:hypothetical protein
LGALLENGTLRYLMSKARDIANILSANTTIATDAEVSSALSAHATAANGHVGRGPTDNRPATPTIGDLYFDTNLNALIAYRTAGWEKVSQDPPPQVSSISPTTASTTGTLINITGSSFKSGLSVKFIGTNSVEYSSPVSTFIGGTSATATTPALPVEFEPYDVKVVNNDNQFGILNNCLDAGGTPTWNTSSGTIATINEQTALNTSVSATDPDGTSIVYSSSNLPSWINLNSSTGALTGTAPDILSNTTYTFDITASDGVNTSSRSFSVSTIYVPPLLIDYLVVAGGGGGPGGTGGGGGGGGLRSTVTATGGGAALESPLTLSSGIAYNVTVGNGGTAGLNDGAAGGPGGNSIFATITSIGGGGGAHGGSGGDGGSGGGAGYGTASGGARTNGQGYAGGSTTNTGNPYYSGGGGGGAGAPGGSVSNSYNGGAGGNGVQVGITGSLVYYAGGGGGGGQSTATGGLGGGGSSTGNTNGVAGTPNTGGGGGAAGRNSANVGAVGGSGIVILKYPNFYTATVSGGLTSSTSTAVSGYKITSFTAGSGTVTFNG